MAEDRRMRKCPTCNGDGKIISMWTRELGGRITRCPRCFGRGRVLRQTPKGDSDSKSSRAVPRRTGDNPQEPSKPRDWDETLEDIAAHVPSRSPSVCPTEPSPIRRSGRYGQDIGGGTSRASRAAPPAAPPPPPPGYRQPNSSGGSGWRRVTVWLIIVVLIGSAFVIFGNEDIRSQIAKFVAELRQSTASAPSPTQAPVAAAPPPTTTLTVTPLPQSPTPRPSPHALASVPLTQTPIPTPTATPTSPPTSTPLPTSSAHSIIGADVNFEGARNGVANLQFSLVMVNTGTPAGAETVPIEMKLNDEKGRTYNVASQLGSGDSKTILLPLTLYHGLHTVTFSIGDSETTVVVDVDQSGIVATNSSAPLFERKPTPIPAPTSTAIRFAPTAAPTVTATPTTRPTTAPTPKPIVRQIIVPTRSPTQTPAPHSAPNLRHLEYKQHMLELINAERQKVGLNAVVLGDNIAAQLHAESSLQNCFSSHWGVGWAEAIYEIQPRQWLRIQQ